MSHEICHCEGTNCELKELCKRYKAHIDAVRKGMKHLSYLVPQNVGSRCESFYRDHEED